MKEFFQRRNLTGPISLTLSNKQKWSADKGFICNKIIAIVQRYIGEGYRLTLRQLYYQLVSGDIIPNDDVVYKKMSSILDDLRYSGQIDWDAIEDRGRVPFLPYWAEGPADAMNDIIEQYRLNRMDDQDFSLEVWTEKDAISGILKRVTSEFHVRLVVNKGYSSSSAMHGAYLRFAKMINAGKKIKILYFGDHDASGLDMLRDIEERLLFFMAAGNKIEWQENGWWERWLDNGFNIYDLESEGLVPEKTVQRLMSENESSTDEDDERFDEGVKMFYLKQNWFEVIPIGLTLDQIEEFRPPPNPAKITDPRAKWYIEKYGDLSWEVDALRPDVMTGIVRDKIAEFLDDDKFEAKMELEKSHVQKMREFAATFEK